MARPLKISLTRRYKFSASHRLWSAKFSEEENRRIYGKCANPHGHGHNYAVEVTITGPVEVSTGMIANLSDLDPFVHREVVDAFDCKNLNEGVAEFCDQVPTTEVLTREIFRRVSAFPKAKVERVRVRETSNNSFELGEDTSTP